jgi:hypothetical protein
MSMNVCIFGKNGKIGNMFYLYFIEFLDKANIFTPTYNIDYNENYNTTICYTLKDHYQLHTFHGQTLNLFVPLLILCLVSPGKSSLNITISKPDIYVVKITTKEEILMLSK